MGQFDWDAQLYHASGLTEASEIQPIEFQNQPAVPIRSLAFWPAAERPHPVSGNSGSMNSTTLN